MQTSATVNGFRLGMRIDGPADAPAVVMCHSLSSDGTMWNEQIPVLGAYRVVRLDMRGHGASEAPPGPYTMSMLAADVAGALDALSIPRAHYVGLSIGGMIGQALALEHADRVRSLMLCDTLPASPAGQASVWQERMDMVRKIGSLAALADGTLQRWFTDEFPAVNPGRLQQIRDALLATSVEGFTGCAAAIQQFDFLDRLATIRIPTLVLCGEDDQGTPVSESRRIAERIPGARLEIVPRARHLPNVERKETFNRILTEWLGSQRQ